MDSESMTRKYISQKCLIWAFKEEGTRGLLVLVQAEYTTCMNEVIRPWVSRETFTPALRAGKYNF